ncbi:ribonuclease HI [bacterium]|nr:ribonuclease HI [bacterium]
MHPLSSATSPLSSAYSGVDAPVVEYLLVCQAQSEAFDRGAWSFALETASGESVLQVEDVETGDLNRLTLLAAVRGLESIDGPASVLLLSNNRYLIRSLSDALPRWRDSNFRWEHFGRKMEVQHADLWKRIDRALSIHCVQACLISSKLVSGGQGQRATRHAWGGTDSWDRVDPSHQAVESGQKGMGDRDGLRRWLLDDVARNAGPAPKRRFDAQDLFESI